MKRKYVTITFIENCHQCPFCKWSFGDKEGRQYYLCTKENRMIGQIGYDREKDKKDEPLSWCPLETE